MEKKTKHLYIYIISRLRQVDPSANQRLNELTKLNNELRSIMADQERKALKLVSETERLHAFSETKIKEGKFWKAKYEEMEEMHKREMKK
jgi:hypothetical protein